MQRMPYAQEASVSCRCVCITSVDVLCVDTLIYHERAGAKAVPRAAEQPQRLDAALARSSACTMA